MAAGHWLVKQEPSTYSWAQFAREKRAAWTGVRNFQARNHLRAMRDGDRVLFYHSGDERAVVGVAGVSREAYPDPTTREGDWSCVDLEAERALPRPVPLAELKTDPALKGLPLLRQSRLSVMPVSAAEFGRIVELGGSKP